ncbi:MAG: hypothetical protein EBS05_09165 [Proteobacteria bacterium]|nr:hypothetical protein [Pseudomonadota bacterium]
MFESVDTLIAFALIFTVVSLLITIVVQIVASALNLRGKNLAWGIAEAFEAIAPELEAEEKGRGKLLADHLLQDHLLSDAQIGESVKLASAVRADELFALLHRIATDQKPGTPAAIKNDVIVLFKSLGVPASVFELVESEKQRLAALKADLDTQLAVLPAGPVKDQLLKVKADTEARLTNTAAYAGDAATRWAAQGEADIQKMYTKFEHWFDTGQERSQEWFATHARVITAILGIVAALVLQLDTIEIYKLVSSNRTVRDNLVAQVKLVTEQGEAILKGGPVLASSLTTIANTTPAANQVTASLKTIAIAPTDTVESVKAKIRSANSNAPAADLQAVLAAFDQETTREVRAQLNTSGAAWTTLNASVDKTGFDLFPSNGCRWSSEPATPRNIFKHAIGMLFSALLLSLGAPFWFNALKSLASLRSSVADNISAEGQAALDNPNQNQTSRPPPSVTQ